MLNWFWHFEQGYHLFEESLRSIATAFCKCEIYSHSGQLSAQDWTHAKRLNDSTRYPTKQQFDFWEKYCVSLVLEDGLCCKLMGKIGWHNLNFMISHFVLDLWFITLTFLAREKNVKVLLEFYSFCLLCFENLLVVQYLIVSHVKKCLHMMHVQMPKTWWFDVSFVNDNLCIL
jgi:hypothetical protein